METLLCNKLQFHTFCERQGWLLLFDKMTDNESTVGYFLQNGSSVLASFIDGEFDHMNDNTNTLISVNTQEDAADES